MLDADHQEQFFCDAHQYGCPDEFYDVSFALHPFDRNEKERQQSQDRGDTYRQGRQCVRRHVLRHNHLVKRVIHRPDQIGQDQAEVGLGLILQCVHGWMIDSWGINSQKTRREYPENDAPSLGTAHPFFFSRYSPVSVYFIVVSCACITISISPSCISISRSPSIR
jgi:hypothetical protein